MFAFQRSVTQVLEKGIPGLLTHIGASLVVSTIYIQF